MFRIVLDNRNTVSVQATYTKPDNMLSLIIDLVEDLHEEQKNESSTKTDSESSTQKIRLTKNMNKLEDLSEELKLAFYHLDCFNQLNYQSPSELNDMKLKIGKF